jgi:hypothetical protein
LVVAGYRKVGSNTRLAGAYCKYWANVGRIRQSALRPGDDVRNILTEMQRSSWWRIYGGDDMRGRSILIPQLLRVVPSGVSVSALTYEEREHTWSETRERLATNPVAWDVGIEGYAPRDRK